MNLQEYKNCLDIVDAQDLAVLKNIVDTGYKFILLGNGGSNAITCHIAQDYTKALGKRAVCFGDSSRMSCYANDYGWDQAYTEYLKQFADPDTIVILISSSGNSKNILNAAQFCVDNKLTFVTMSGFDKNNQLRTQYSNKSLHFYVPSHDYGVVECLHELILHSVI